MSIYEKEDVAIQSYFEARTNIREAELRQLTTIQFFLGAYAAISGGCIALLRIVDDCERSYVAIALVFLTSLLSVGVFFLWCSTTLMIIRAAHFCLDIINDNYSDKTLEFWETWVRSSRNTTSLPYLYESTLSVFIAPILASFALAILFSELSRIHLVINGVVGTVAIAILISQFIWVLKAVKKGWGNAEAK